MSGPQLGLRFPPRHRCTLAGFEPAGNVELLDRLAAEPTPRFTCTWISGERGSGKSHLLQAACAHVTEQGAVAAYLPADLATAGAAVLDGLDSAALVAVDDITAWLGQHAVEAALLALYQALLMADGALVVASASVPNAVRFALDDLASRLRAAATFRITGLDDAARARLLTRAAAERGMTLGPEVAGYVLRRAPRATPDLLAVLERLDVAAMAGKRRLSVALAREVLDAMPP